MTIQQWYQYGGGIMVYDYDGTDDTTETTSNSDVSAYMYAVYLAQSKYYTNNL
jgi:hypothetical protein